MKPAVLAGVVIAAFGLFPSSAAAINITQTFCLAGSNPASESNSCPNGLLASLNITDEDLALPVGEVNDFFVYLKLDSTGGITKQDDATVLTGIEAVQFDTKYKASDYESTPTVNIAGLNGTSSGFTSASFGDINDCDAIFNSNDKSVCSVGLTDTGNLDVWRFYIDLRDDFNLGDHPLFTATSDLNLRASFQPSGNLSPGGVEIPETRTGGTGGADPAGGTAVPEPASLMLLGSGLALAATRLRRRK